jgi:hypothetical protein
VSLFFFSFFFCFRKIRTAHTKLLARGEKGSDKSDFVDLWESIAQKNVSEAGCGFFCFFSFPLFFCFFLLLAFSRFLCGICSCWDCPRRRDG